jgi:hypothetical protein
MDIKQIAGDNAALKVSLRKDPKLRSKYLVLYDLVNNIVDVNQRKFALLATTARKHLASTHMYIQLTDNSQPIGEATSRPILISSRETTSLSSFSIGRT